MIRMLCIINRIHLLLLFCDMDRIEEAATQDVVCRKLDDGLSRKPIEDMQIVLKTILIYGVKNKETEHSPIDIEFPTGLERHDMGF